MPTSNPKAAPDNFVTNSTRIISGILAGQENMRAGRTVPHDNVMRKGEEIIRQVAARKTPERGG